MNLIVTNMKWIMIVSGALTCTMIYAALAPQAALLSQFGESLVGPVAEIVVRNWGVLITLIGALLIYGAFTPLNRPLILIVAGASKLAFIALVLAFGGQFLGRQAGIVIAIDTVMVALYVVYLLGTRRRAQVA